MRISASHWAKCSFQPLIQNNDTATFKILATTFFKKWIYLLIYHLSIYLAGKVHSKLFPQNYTH